MFRDVRLWVWIFWAAALLAAAASARAEPSVEARIHYLQPRAQDAHRLAKAVHRAATTYKVSAWVLVGLAMQESSLRPQHRWYPDGSGDLGVFQINSKTAEAHGCRLEALLLFEPEESARCAALVLRHKRDVCLARGLTDHEANACYHNYLPKHRLRYLKALERWL